MENIELAVAVELSRAVNSWYRTAKEFEDLGLAVPESEQDAWEQFMRIRDAAEVELAKML